MGAFLFAAAREVILASSRPTLMVLTSWAAEYKMGVKPPPKCLTRASFKNWVSLVTLVRAQERWAAAGWGPGRVGPCL